MKTVLVPIGNDSFTDELIRFIKLYIPAGTYKVHLVHIYTSFVASELEDIKGKPRQAEKFLEEATLQDCEEQLKKAGYITELSFLTGIVEQKFVELANTLHPSFILMATGGSANMLENMVGTGAYNIFEKTHVPVFVIPRGCNIDKLKKALVALQLENESPEILERYFEYADNRDLQSEYIHVDSTSEMNIVDDESVLAGFKNRYPGRIHTVKYKKATSVPKGILEFAHQSGADLIVLFTERRNVIERIFHVSVTRDMILHSKKPLLIFRYG